VQSSGRGEHRFYRIPAESSIGNSTAPLESPPDLHLRAGSRGYVVAAPSLHASGTRYRWLEPDASIAELPQPWLERMVGLQRLPEREPTTPLAGVLGPAGGRYGQAALEGELHKIRLAPEGTRNETLNRSVFRLAQLAAGGELGLEVIEHKAKAAALAAGLPEREVDITIHYALTAGYRFPRSRKPR
jgi:Bifunctional DNA primase/polymerase, N-terminal